MDKEYYYLNGDTKVGPFSLDALKSAPINRETLVWNNTLPDWVAAYTLPELQGFFTTTATPPPPKYDRTEPSYNTNVSENINKPTVDNTYKNPNVKPPMPENYLVWAILATIFCSCAFPLGIVAIVKASKVSSAYGAGDYTGAQKASEDAKKWTIWTAIIGGILALLIVILYVIGIAAIIAGTETASSY